MSICIAVPKHLIYVLPFSHLNKGIQGSIDIIISLHRKKCIFITVNWLIVKHLTITIIRLITVKENLL